MTFQEVLAQVITWLKHDKRLSYRALQRQFGLNAAYLADLKLELIQSNSLPWTRRAQCWCSVWLMPRGL
jgi:hypothetical protein